MRPSKTALFEATKRLDHRKIRAMLEAQPKLIGVREPNGNNLLHRACHASAKVLGVPEKRAIPVADEFLDRGIPIDELVGKDRCTALFFAVARARNLALVAHLLDRGAKLENAPGHGLFAAGWWEDVKIIDLLVRRGADVGIVAGQTPFLACWSWKRFYAARRFFGHGSDLNWADKKGRTALHVGVEREFPTAELLWIVRRGANPDLPDRDGVTARVRASRKRDKRWLEALDG